MYRKLGEITPQLHQSLLDLSAVSEWKLILGSGRDYQTSFVDVTELFDWHFHQAFFLKIPPNGKVHKHIDADHAWKTNHIVVQTNPEARSFAGGEEYHLEERGIYAADRSSEHWSENRGLTDRIHLLAEIYD